MFMFAIMELTRWPFKCNETRDPKCKPRTLIVEVLSVTLFLLSFIFSSRNQNHISINPGLAIFLAIDNHSIRVIANSGKPVGIFGAGCIKT